jgi:O-antigen ligase
VVALAAMLGLFEGPAQVLTVVCLVLAVGSGAAQGWRPGVVLAGVLLWGLAGIPGLVVMRGHGLSSGETTRPLMALALGVGAWSLAGASAAAQRRAAWAFCGALVLNGAYGLAQWRFGALPWDHLFLKNPDNAQLYIPGRVFHERAASGLFYNRLRLAHIGVVGLGLLGLVALRRGLAGWTRVVAGLGAAVLGAAVVLTYARTAVLGGAAGVAAVLLVRTEGRRLRTLAAVGLTGALAGATFLLTEYGRRRFTDLLPDLELRRAMFESALGMFADHPVLGVGHGVYRVMAETYARPPLAGVHLTSPHNQWLQVLAETGAVGALGFTVAWGAALLRAARAARRTGALREEAVLLGLVALSVVGLFHSTLHHGAVALVYWTLVGAAAVAPQGEDGRWRSTSEAR